MRQQFGGDEITARAGGEEEGGRLNGAEREADLSPVPISAALILSFHSIQVGLQLLPHQTTSNMAATAGKQSSKFRFITVISPAAPTSSHTTVRD